ncbi:MAG: hypothetical protein NZM12_13520, partial [Steroidobacteraceae bacterium]|nr:hypothetical protein [Steroidobacteraceae bacterium]MDW8258314.1 hypothetical protein [Gammaproteobacteria bacterium]
EEVTRTFLRCSFEDPRKLIDIAKDIEIRFLFKGIVLPGAGLIGGATLSAADIGAAVQHD